jgi:amidase
MSDKELCYLSAVEALERFKTRKLSPVELMQALISRAEAVEPRINAFPMTNFERALEQARAAEAKYMKTDGRPRPLEGIAVAIKDETAVKGARTTYGSLIFRDNIDTIDSGVVERLKRAGAIFHARSAAPEFSCAAICHSKLWGVTRNPWNPDYTPGGSSGGAAASLAAGTTTLANGSDIGGSIRIPASACGVVGFKPPHGRNPEDVPFNLDLYSHSGPLARTVADCRLMQNVISGPHPRDIASLRPKLRIPERRGDIKGWRIAYSLDLGYFEVDPEVARNTEATLQTFRDLGATVEPVDLGWTLACLSAAMNHLGHLFGAYIGQHLSRHRHELTDYARAFAEFADPGRAGGCRGARSDRHELRDQRRQGRPHDRLVHDLPLQHHEPLPGHVRAERLRRERRADRNPDRRPDLRRRQRVPRRRRLRSRPSLVGHAGAAAEALTGSGSNGHEQQLRQAKRPFTGPDGGDDDGAEGGGIASVARQPP